MSNMISYESKNYALVTLGEESCMAASKSHRHGPFYGQFTRVHASIRTATSIGRLNPGRALIYLGRLLGLLAAGTLLCLQL